MNRWLVALCLFLVAGCGYRLPSGGGMSHEGVSSYSVGIFTNSTYRVGLDTEIRRMLDEEISGRQGLTVKPSGQADAEFTGTVVSYGTTAVSSVRQVGSDGKHKESAREYRAVITVDAVLRQSATNRPLWKGRVTVTQDFPANSNPALQQNSEEAAVQELARKVARQIYLHQQDNF